jgi:polar amino acid transport system substrate-binding protein
MLTGLLYDTWDDLAKRADVAYIPVELPPARLVKMIADGEVDVTLSTISFPDFADKTLFSKRPALHIILEAYTLAPFPKLASLRDLNGRSVILQQGYGYGGLISYLKAPENGITIAGTVPNAEVALRMLQAGRADYMLNYRPTIEALKQRLNVQGLQSNLLSNLPLHVVVSKSVPQAEQLMARFDAAIAARPPSRPN